MHSLQNDFDGVAAMNLGPFIKQAREGKELSLSAAARAVGCTKSHLWDLEQGRSTNPTIQTLVGISNALGVEIGKLARIAAAQC